MYRTCCKCQTLTRSVISAVVLYANSIPEALVESAEALVESAEALAVRYQRCLYRINPKVRNFKTKRRTVYWYHQRYQRVATSSVEREVVAEVVIECVVLVDWMRTVVSTRPDADGTIVFLLLIEIIMKSKTVRQLQKHTVVHSYSRDNIFSVGKEQHKNVYTLVCVFTTTCPWFGKLESRQS